MMLKVMSKLSTFELWLSAMHAFTRMPIGHDSNNQFQSPRCHNKLHLTKQSFIYFMTFLFLLRRENYTTLK